MKAAGAKQRHIERCRYNPNSAAVRKTRTVGNMTQTYKRRGDVIINLTGDSIKVPRSGWY